MMMTGPWLWLHRSTITNLSSTPPTWPHLFYVSVIFGKIHFILFFELSLYKNRQSVVSPKKTEGGVKVCKYRILRNLMKLMNMSNKYLHVCTYLLHIFFMLAQSRNTCKIVLLYIDRIVFEQWLPLSVFLIFIFIVPF